MAELCTRKRCVSEIEDIVTRAKERIVLVSPYIKADKSILEDLKRKIDEVDIVVIYGKDKDQPHAKSLFEVRDITKIFVKDLHSKCYLNEEKALVTSMNLYEYSQNNNEEMGVLVTKERDEKLYEDVIKLVERWEAKGEKQSLIRDIWHSVKSAMEPEPKTPKPTKVAGSKTPSKTQSKLAGVPKKGFCIRCHNSVNIRPKKKLKPYCPRCYDKWERSNQTLDHRESYCHVCGQKHNASLSRPACKECWENYKDAIDFKSAAAKIA